MGVWVVREEAAEVQEKKGRGHGWSCGLGNVVAHLRFPRDQDPD